MNSASKSSISASGVQELSVYPDDDSERFDSDRNRCRVFYSQIGIGVTIPHVLVATRHDTERDEDSAGRLRFLLTRLGDVAAAHGVVAPVIGVVWGYSDRTVVERWSNDQSWHRGDFILQAANDAAAAARAVEALLKPPQEDDISGLIPDTISIDGIKTAVAGQIHDLLPDQPHAVDLIRLTDNLLTTDPPTIAQDMPAIIMNWIRSGGSDADTVNAPPPSRPKVDQKTQNKKPHFQPCIDRITRVNDVHFRGMFGHRSIDLDADLVLVLGGNGSGKSSLLEAINWGLTGYLLPERVHHGGVEPISAADSKDGKSPRPASNPGFGLTLHWKTRQVGVGRGDDADSVDTDEQLPDIWTSYSHKMIQGDRRPDFMSEEREELWSRLTAFFQDEHRYLFDERASKSTLRELLQVLPPSAEALAKTLASDDLKQAVHRRLQEVTTREDELSLDQGSRIWIKIRNRLKDLITAFAALRPEGEEEPFKLDTIDGWRALARTLNREPILADAQEWIFDYISRSASEIQDSMTASLPDGANYRELQIELERVDAAIADGARNASMRASAAAWLRGNPAGDPELGGDCELVRLFSRLSTNLTIWRNPPPEIKNRCARIEEEMRLVVADRVLACLQEAKALQDLALAPIAELENLERQRSEIEASIKLIQEADPRTAKLAAVRKAAQGVDWTSIPWGSYELWEADQNNKDQLLASLKDERRRAGGVLKLTAVDPSSWTPDIKTQLVGAIETATSRAMQLFSFSGVASRYRAVPNGGVAAPSRDPDRVTLDGERGVEHFSSGQRAQMASAVLVGQKRVALAQSRFQFPNRILILDDPSTSSDLTNLVRTAVLVRQLAYHPVKEQRLQIFLSSHHDGLSHRLIDLLVPPKDATMRVLQLGEWHKDTGPSIESIEVEPSAAVTTSLCKSIGKLLSTVAC